VTFADSQLRKLTADARQQRINECELIRRWVDGGHNGTAAESPSAADAFFQYVLASGARSVDEALENLRDYEATLCVRQIAAAALAEHDRPAMTADQAPQPDEMPVIEHLISVSSAAGEYVIGPECPRCNAWLPMGIGLQPPPRPRVLANWFVTCGRCGLRFRLELREG